MNGIKKLRKWFDHKEERFEEFSSKYKKELLEHNEEFKRIKNIAEKQKICLLYGAKDEKHNQAIILKNGIENTK